MSFDAATMHPAALDVTDDVEGSHCDRHPASLPDPRDQALIVGGSSADVGFDVVVYRHNSMIGIISKSLDIVRKFIGDNKRLLKGGMAIDLALRTRGSQLYTSETMPDYDFISPTFHHDAYNLAKLLRAAGLAGVSVINAMHTSTMRVRVDFNFVADIEYVPPSVYEALPYIEAPANLIKDGESGAIRLIHPYFQIIDQHLALGTPYGGYPLENITSRWSKDIVRHNLLTKFFQITDDKEIIMSQLSEGGRRRIAQHEITIPLTQLTGQCIGGFAALYMWQAWAKRDGYDDISDVLGSATVSRSAVHMQHIRQPVTIYSAASGEFAAVVGGEFRRINPFLEKLPAQLVSAQWEILDTEKSRIGAHTQDGITVANPQVLLTYFATKFIMHKFIYPERDDKSDAEFKSYYPHYLAYQQMANIVTWASAKYCDGIPMQKYLPTAVVYGVADISGTYEDAKKMLLVAIGSCRPSYDRPKGAHLDSGDIRDDLYLFDPSKSPIYQFDGLPARVIE